MIPRTSSRRPARSEEVGLLRIAPDLINRRSDAEPPGSFLVNVPPGGLSLQAAWAVCWTYAHEVEGGRHGAAVAAFLALADAHEAARLPVLDADGRLSRWTLHELDALSPADLARADDAPRATVARGPEGDLVLTPPTDTRSAA